MSRDFTKNTANFLSLGANALGVLLHGASKISFHAIVTYDAVAGSDNADRALHISIANAVSGVVLGTSATSRLRVGGRSVSGDAFQTVNGTTVLSTGVEYSIGGVLDISGDVIRVYLNGAQEASTGVTFGNTTYTNGTPTTSNDYLGGEPTTVASQVDGRVSEAAFWAGDIGTAGFQQLAQRRSALGVRPDLLVFYAPLWGNASPEPDLVGGRTGTITGTVAKAVHPRIIRARPRRFWTVPAASGVTHATDGALVGSGAAVAGTAAHVAIHATSGVLTGPGATLAGVAARTRQHATDGVLAGPGAVIAGTAAHVAIHATSGVLAGPGTVLEGTAARAGPGATTHETTGVLAGQGTTVAGTAARVRQFLTAGDLIAQGSIVLGVATRTRVHDASGALVGPGAVVAGTAARLAPGSVLHDATGTLVGQGATLDGAAQKATFSRSSMGGRYRQITIEYKSTTQDAVFGTEIVTWLALCSCRAELQDALPSRSEAVTQGLAVARNQTRLRCRWRNDVTSDMRVVIHGGGDRVMQIVGGPAQIGRRRESMELVLEKYSS